MNPSRLPVFARLCMTIGLLVAIFGGARLWFVYVDQAWSNNRTDTAMAMWFQGPERFEPDPEPTYQPPVSPTNADGTPKDVMLYRRDLFPIDAKMPPTPNRERAFRAIVLIASGLAVALTAWILPSRIRHESQ